MIMLQCKFPDGHFKVKAYVLFGFLDRHFKVKSYSLLGSEVFNAGSDNIIMLMQCNIRLESE